MLSKRIYTMWAVVPFLWLASPAAGQGIKWTPGHYVMFGTEDSRATVLRQIEEIGKEPTIKGFQVRVRWSNLERSKGNYNFSDLDAYMNKAKAVKKQMVIRVIDRKFNTWNKSGIVPDYLMTSTYKGGVVRSSTGYVARIWEKPVMDRLIALYKAIGRRYDDEIRFEGMATEETTLSLRTPFPSGYSHQALANQYKRLTAAARDSMPRSNVFLYTNYIGSPTIMDDLMGMLMVQRSSAGGSNVVPGKKSLGQKVWTGVYGADYTRQLALSSSVEMGELISHTPKQIGAWAYNELKLDHVFWARNTWAGDKSKRWSTGILPYLRTNPPIRTRCPDSYAWCMKTN